MASCCKKTEVSEENRNNNDLLVFTRDNKSKFTSLVENEIEMLGSVKVSFELNLKFQIERNGWTQNMRHYFKENKPCVFNRHDEEKIKQKFDEFIERYKGRNRELVREVHTYNLYLCTMKSLKLTSLWGRVLNRRKKWKCLE